MPAATEIDRFAQRIATGVTRDHRANIIAELGELLESAPEGLFDSLDGLVRAAGKERADENLCAAYVSLLEAQLELLRYRIDGGFRDAIALKDRFEARLAGDIRSGRLSTMAVSEIGRAMDKARLSVGGDVRTAMSERLATAGAAFDSPPDVGSLLQQLADGIDDPFAFLQVLGADSATLPPAMRSTAAALILSAPHPVLHEAAALLILDSDPEVRRATATALLARIETVTPATLRRLIVVRHWLPDDERPLVDQVVRAARTKGVACGNLAPVSELDVQAFGVDGSGAIDLLIVSPADRKKRRLSSVLMRVSAGMLDAWSDVPQNRRCIEEMLAHAGSSAGSTRVTTRFLDLAVCHHLAVGLEQGRVPPLGLLQVAETLGAGEWRPRKIDPQAAIDELLATRDEDVRAVLRGSADWAEAIDATPTWFEADQEVADLLDRAKGRSAQRLVSLVIASVLERRRAKWADYLAWTALRLEAEAPVPDPLWRPLAIVAREIAGGRPLDEIPLMREIASRTIDAHRPSAGAPDTADFPWDLLLSMARGEADPRPRRGKRRR
jgi:hypothetical protein